MAPKTYRFCKWLIEKLLKKRYMTFEEINEEWKNDRSMSNGVELLRRLSTTTERRSRNRLASKSYAGIMAAITILSRTRKSLGMTS